MVGLGEEKREVYQVMDDLRSAGVDFLTIGQYLQPTPRHHPVARFVPPDEFEDYARMARAKGFLHGLGVALDPQLAITPATTSSVCASAREAALAAAAE